MSQSTTAQLTSRAGLRTAEAAWSEVLRTSHALLRQFEAAGDFGELSTREYDVLRALADAGGQGLRLGALAEAVYLPQPSMSRIVERMESRGLVQRTPCPLDARGIVVALTAVGRERQREIGRRHLRSIRAAMTAALDAAELTTLTTLLRRVRESQEETTA